MLFLLCCHYEASRKGMMMLGPTALGPITQNYSLSPMQTNSNEPCATSVHAPHRSAPTNPPRISHKETHSKHTCCVAWAAWRVELDGVAPLQHIGQVRNNTLQTLRPLEFGMQRYSSCQPQVDSAHAHGAFAVHTNTPTLDTPYHRRPLDTHLLRSRGCVVCTT
jgi:hypothetical protein